MVKETGDSRRPTDVSSNQARVPHGESLGPRSDQRGIAGLTPQASEAFPDPSWKYTRTSEPTIAPLPDEPDDSQPQGRTQILSPRAQKAGAVLNIVASLAPMMSPVYRPTELGPIKEPPYVYGQDYSHKPNLYDLSTEGAPGIHKGVVRLPQGDLPIVDLAVHVDPEDFPVKPGQAVRVSTIEDEARDDTNDGEVDRYELQTGDTVLFTDGSSWYPDYDHSQPMGIPVENGNINGVGKSTTDKPADLRVSGANDGMLIVETFDTQTGAVTGTEVYQEHITPTAICEDGTELVVAVDVPAYTAGLCAVEDLYDDYIDRPARVVVNHADQTYSRESHFDPPDNVVRFSLPEESDTGPYDTSNDVKVHEFAHVVYEGLDEDVKERFAGTHRIVMNNMRYRMPTFAESNNYLVDKNEPVWAIYTEQTYYQKLGRDDTGGHPYDEPTELFASTINSVRTFPDLVQDEFTTLRPNEQHAAGIVLVEVANALLSKNANPAALRRVMPELGSTLKVMRGNAANKYYGQRMDDLIRLVG